MSVKKQPKDTCLDPERECPAQDLQGTLNTLTTQLAVHIEHMEGSILRIEEVVNKASKVLFGNGTPGIVIRLDRLETAADERTKRENQIRKWLMGVGVALIVQAAVTAGGIIWAVVRMAVKAGAL